VCPWAEDPDVARHFEARVARGEKTVFGYTLYLWFEGDEAFHSQHVGGRSIADLYRTSTAYRSDPGVAKRVEIAGVMPLPARLADRERGMEDDVAVLKVSEVPQDALPIPLASRTGGGPAVRGTSVLAIGFPYGRDPIVGSRVVANWSKGTITSAYAGTLATDAALHSGNSGGPVIDLEGRAVGIASAVFMARLTEVDNQGRRVQRRMSASDMGRVLPIEKAAAFLEELRAGRPRWLGIPAFAYRQRLEPALAAARAGKWHQAATIAGALPERLGDPDLSYWIAVLSPEFADAGQRAEALERAVAIQPTHFPAHFLRYCDDWLAGLPPARRRSRQELLAADWRSEGEFFGAAVRLIEHATDGSWPDTFAESAEESGVLGWMAATRPGSREPPEARRKRLLDAQGRAAAGSAFALVIRHALDRTGPWTESDVPSTERPVSHEDAKKVFLKQFLDALEQDAPQAARSERPRPSPLQRDAFAKDAFQAAANGDWDAAAEMAERFLEHASERRSAHWLRAALLQAQLQHHRGDVDALQSLAALADGAWHARIAQALLGGAEAARPLLEAAQDDDLVLTLRTALGLNAELSDDVPAAREHYRFARDTLLEGWPEFTVAHTRLQALQ
jgi:hypothetical protein